MGEKRATHGLSERDKCKSHIVTFDMIWFDLIFSLGSLICFYRWVPIQDLDITLLFSKYYYAGSIFWLFDLKWNWIAAWSNVKTITPLMQSVDSSNPATKVWSAGKTPLIDSMKIYLIWWNGESLEPADVGHGTIIQKVSTLRFGQVTWHIIGGWHGPVTWMSTFWNKVSLSWDNFAHLHLLLLLWGNVRASQMLFIKEVNTGPVSLH